MFFLFGKSANADFFLDNPWSVWYIYIENICVSGITFDYEGAVPVGMCRAKKFYYVTTAGGPIFCDYGYSYWESLCKSFFGIQETCCIKAEGLDMIAPDQVAQKLQQVKDEMKSLL